jgi:ferritin-like metal-binding protein YciE
MADNKNLDTVQQYVGDMVSLESHIEEALDGQMRELETRQSHPQAAQLIHRFHSMVRSHRDTLKEHLKSIGGSESHPLKEAVSGLFGMAAGAIDNIRTKDLSKSLRDDYTAFNHAAIGYAMLYTTARALGHPATADVAEGFLRDYAKAVQEINQVISDVAIWELRQESGLMVDESAARHATEMLNSVWRETSPSQTMPRAA